MTVIAFIPARAGSKGVVKKNVRPVGGRPLIAHTIDAALASQRIDHVVVTTDCPDCKAVAANCGVIVIDRPADLAGDTTPTFPVIEHAIEVLQQLHGLMPSLVVLLQCTSPLRTAEHIDEALKLFDDPSVSAVTSVSPVGDLHPARMYTKSDGDRLEPFEPRFEQLRRQELPEVFHRNGAIYALRRQECMAQRTLIAAGAKAYVMAPECSINIDAEIDLVLADAILRHREQAG